MVESSPAKQTAFRLTDEDLGLLDVIQADRGFSTRVQALRFAVREWCGANVGPESPAYLLLLRSRCKSPEDMRAQAEAMAELAGGAPVFAGGEPPSAERRRYYRKVAGTLEREAERWARELKGSRSKR